MKRNVSGFTIVELLIVIVVIAILAAISIVAYNGVQERARDSALKNDLSNAAKQMMLARAKTDSMPTTLPDNVSASEGNVLQLSTTATPNSTFCINGYGSDNKYMSYWSKGGLKEHLCSGAALGNPVGGSVPDVPKNTNLASDFSTWEVSGGVSYNESTGELVLSPTASGVASSPLIRVNESSNVRISVEAYATQASQGYPPDTQVYWGTNYFAEDGVTPVENTGGWTGNGNAQTLSLNQWQSFTWTPPLGPGIEYVQFRIHSAHTSRTSDNRYRNVQILIPQ